MGDRLIGLDLARYLAFVGMVFVNFDVAIVLRNYVIFMNKFSTKDPSD